MNGNGRRDTEDVGLAGWTIYLDLNNNGQPDAGEPQTVTDQAGAYWFTDVLPGKYTVAEIVQPGWVQTFPGNVTYLNFEDLPAGAMFVAGATLTTVGTDGVPMAASVMPFVLQNGNMVNGFARIDGQGIAGGGGKDIQLNNVNLNFNFAPPLGSLELNFADLGGSINLSINGTFRFLQDLQAASGQTIGGVMVEVELQPDGKGILRLTGTINSFAIGGQELWIDRLCKHPLMGGDKPGVHVVDVSADQRVERVDFGNTRLGEIHGRKWLDRNGNGQRDENEPVLPGWTIYLDLNSNGMRDAGEPSIVTDENGNYWFTGLPPGTYTVAEVPQSGWEQTFPAPKPSQDLFEFEDVNPAITYHVNDAFTTVANAGAVANVTLEPFFFTSGGSTAGGSARAGNLGTIPPNQVLLINNTNLDFDFVDAVSSLALVFSDVGGNVNLSVNGVLRNVPNLSSLNGQMVGGAVILVNQLTDNLGILTVTGTIDAFAIGGQEFWIDKLAISGGPVDGTGVHVVDVRGDMARERNFGNRPKRGEIHGTKFIDFDGDGVRGPNDRGIIGWTIFIDLNNNGRLDPSEPTTKTDENGEYWFTDLVPGKYIVREVEQEGWTRTSPIVTFIGRQFAAGERPIAIDSADFSGDDASDLVVGDLAGEAVALLKNNGDGTFAAPTLLPVGDTPIDIRLADMDGDGDQDLVVLLLSKARLVTYANNGAGSFAVLSDIPAGKVPAALAVADFNGDEKPDVAVAEFSGDAVNVFLNDGAGKPVAPAKISPPVSAPSIWSPGTSIMMETLTWLCSTSTRVSFRCSVMAPAASCWPTRCPLAAAPARLAVDDFDQDGNPDIAVAGSGDAIVYFGLSSATELVFSAAGQTLPGLDLATAVATGDFDGDEFPDLLVTDRDTNEVKVFFSRPGRTFVGPLSEVVGVFPFAVTVEDFNSDGMLDAATADSVEPGVTVLLQGPRDGYLVEIAGGDVHLGRDFGNFRNGRITGRKLHDTDCDGVLTGLEPGLPGFTIYVDLDDDGVLDPNEPFAVSDAAGNYAIENVPPGTYSVREVVLEDWAQSFPATGRHIVTISQSNQTVLNRHFGNFQHVPLPDGKDNLFGAGGNDRCSATTSWSIRASSAWATTIICSAWRATICSSASYATTRITSAPLPMRETRRIRSSSWKMAARTNAGTRGSSTSFILTACQ